MANEKKKYVELSVEEQQLLSARYGIQPKSGGGYSKYVIDYVRDINDDEKIFFQEKSFLSPHFLTQSLYKLKGNLQTIRVNRVLKEKISSLTALRTNYVALDNRIVAVVFEDRKDLPPAVFRTLITDDKEELDSKLRIIMEADMRESFDLVRGHLIRFSFYKVAEDEYAVLVTMAHLIFGGVDLTEIFREFLGNPVSKSNVKTENIPYVADNTAIKAYWGKILDKLPALPRLPYVKNDVFVKKQSKVYRKKLSEDLTGELLRISKSNRMLLMAIIESAWSILLAEFNNMNDIFFSALLPDKKANLNVPNVRAMPVRIKINGDNTVEQFVMSNFQQIIVSKPYSAVQIDALNISGNANRIFNHFLSFYDFLDEEKNYSDVPASEDGALVLRNSWDSGPSHIGLYFQYENGSVTLTLIYNENSFLESNETLLINRFFRVILQLVNDYNTPFSVFLPRLKERIKAEEENTPIKGNIELYIRYELGGTDIFKDLVGEDITFLQKNSTIKRFFEGDRISGKDLVNNLAFLIKGRAARNVDTGDGWYRTLDISRERALLNVSYFVGEPKMPMSVEILTDEAEVLFIKKESVESIIRKTHFVGKNLLDFAVREMEKYQYLWIQS